MDEKPVGVAKVCEAIKKALGILSLLGISLLIGYVLGLVYLPFFTWYASHLASTDGAIFFFYLVALACVGALIWFVIGGLSSYMAIRQPIVLIFCPILVAAPIAIQAWSYLTEPATPCILLIITLHAVGIERDEFDDLEWMEERNTLKAHDRMNGITCPHTLTPIALETRNEQIGIDALSRMLNPKAETLYRVSRDAHARGVRETAERMLRNLPEAISMDRQMEMG